MPIKFTQQFLILSVLTLALGLAVHPHPVDAFWPFSTNANAAHNGLVPSSTTPALVAKTNANPNAGNDMPLPTSGDTALVSYSGPSGTIADVIDTPQSDSISVYVVRPGDTLSVIASMFNVSVNTIIWANNLAGIKDVHPGDTLIILPISGVKRTVAKGDTLKSLAKKYDADPDEIAQFNGLDSGAALAIGSTIIIPGGEVTTATPAKKKSVAGSVKTSTAPYLGGSGPSHPGYYRSPVPGARVTQGLHGHNGVDFGAHKGTPIGAAADGTVIIARNSGWNGGYGNYVVVSHPNGSQTLYAHMTNTIVSTGQSVTGGQIIGYVGNTGKSTGAHLHFEVRGATNPFGY